MVVYRIPSHTTFQILGENHLKTGVLGSQAAATTDSGIDRGVENRLQNPAPGWEKKVQNGAP